MMAAGLPRAAVLISGGGTNLQAIIDAQAAGELPLEIAAVISDRPQAFGLQRAAAAGIPALCLRYQDYPGREQFAAALAEELDAIAADIIALAGFMRILPDALVNQWTGRMLNIHPSLLPLYPGLDTYRRVLAAGDSQHGSTVHFVIPELDAGPAIIQYRVAIREGETPESLAARVRQGEYRIYPRALNWLASGQLVLRDGMPWLDDRPLNSPVIVDE